MTGARYNHLNDVIEDLYEDGKLEAEDFDDLCKAIDALDNRDKYKWHDLRKNPDDLPSEDTWVYVVDDSDYQVPYSMALFHNSTNWFQVDSGDYDVLAWKYIEPFDEVEE